MPKKLTTQQPDNPIKAQFDALSSIIPGIGEEAQFVPVPPEKILHTPSTSLNIALGRDRGVREGSVVMYYGPWMSFKTATALEMCRQAQSWKPDKPVAFVDVECRVDIDAAKVMYGIRTGMLDSGVPAFVYLRPPYAEKAWMQIIQMVRSGAFSLVVVDSLKAMVPKSLIENDDEEKLNGVVAHQARVNSNTLPIVSLAAEQTGTIVWLINQQRIVKMNRQTGVATTSFTGGEGLGYYTTHIIRVEYMPKAAEEDGTDIFVFTEKNKFDKPYRKIEIPVVFGHGIDAEGDLIQVASDHGLIKKGGGGWFEFENGKKFQGLTKAGEYLAANPEIFKELQQRVYQLS